MKKLLAFMITLWATLWLSFTGFAQEDPVKERQALMKTVAASLGLSIKMIKGQEPYDATKAAEAMTKISNASDKFNALMVEGTDSDAVAISEASPKIWQDRAGFEKILNKLKTSSAKAAEVAQGGPEAFQDIVFGDVSQTCSACHKAYRIKKN